MLKCFFELGPYVTENTDCEFIKMIASGSDSASQIRKSV